MFSIFKKARLFLILAFFIATPLFFSLPATAADESSATKGEYGLTETLGTNNLKSALINSSPQSMVGSIIGVILSFLGVIFFVLVIVGGLLWMFSQGNEAKVEKAKNILVAAVIGLVIVLAAYAITSFIGQQLTKTT